MLNLPLRKVGSLSITGAVCCLTIGLLTPAKAAVLFDFESTAATFNSPPDLARPGALTSLAVTNGGLTLTLTRPGATRFDVVNNTGNQGGKPAAFFSRSIDPFFAPGPNGFIGNLSQAVTSVSLQYGDYGDDSDTLTLSAFSGLNGTGTLLASTTDNYGLAAFPAFDTVSLSAAGIQSFTINGTSSSAGFENSVFYDNFSFGTATAVPEPVSLSIVGAGLAALMVTRRRARRRAS